MEKILIAKRIKTPDGTLLWSRHRHDYVSHIDKITGCEYVLDGGNEEYSWSRNLSNNNCPYENLFVYSTDDFEEVRKVMLRGTNGKNGNEDFKFVPLCEMSNEWILNVIEYIQNIEPHITDYESITNQEVFLELYHKELDYRYDRQIVIED